MYSMDVHIDVVTREWGSFRFYFLRKFEKVLIYRGETLDTLASYDTRNGVSKYEFIAWVEDYMQVYEEAA